MGIRIHRFSPLKTSNFNKGLAAPNLHSSKKLGNPPLPPATGILDASADHGSVHPMLFELEGVPGVPTYQDDHLDSKTQVQLDELFSHADIASQNLMRNAVYASQSSGGCLLGIADQLSRLGYDVSPVTTETTTEQGTMFRKLRHNFLLVRRLTTDFIIDTAFRDSFEISRPTPRYSAILNQLPIFLVTSKDSLVKIVALLSAEMRRCFESQSMPLPPWRAVGSLLSKWNLKAGANTAVNTPAPAMHAYKALYKSQVYTLPSEKAAEEKENDNTNRHIITATVTTLPAKARFVGFNVPTPASASSLKIDSDTRSDCSNNECFCCGWRRELRGVLIRPWDGSAPAA